MYKLVLTVLYVPSSLDSGVRETLGCSALPTETKVESGTSQSKHGTSVNLCNIGRRHSM